MYRLSSCDTPSRTDCKERTSENCLAITYLLARTTFLKLDRPEFDEFLATKPKRRESFPLTEYPRAEDALVTAAFIAALAVKEIEPRVDGNAAAVAEDVLKSGVPCSFGKLLACA